MSDTSRGHDPEDLIGGDLTEEDRSVLRLWRETMMVMDGRYHDKELLKVVARSMSDGAFRSRLIADTAAAMGEFESRLPSETTIHFHVNTPTTINVVLPPSAGETALRSEVLCEALRSRTAGDAFCFFEDDWNLSDYGTRDSVILLPAEQPADAPDPPLGDVEASR
jgi:hypothetical protein